MPFDENEPYSRSIETDLAKFRPIGDFVLVRPFSEREQLIMEDRTIAQSPLTMTRDGRYLFNRPRGLQYGTVVAMGAGDLAIALWCGKCGLIQSRIERGQESRKWRCSSCASRDVHSKTCRDDELAGLPAGGTARVSASRIAMGCQLGDVVLFPRVPANEVRLNGEEFVCLHEEQHVLAVIDGPMVRVDIEFGIGAMAGGEA